MSVTTVHQVIRPLSTTARTFSMIAQPLTLTLKGLVKGLRTQGSYLRVQVIPLDPESLAYHIHPQHMLG